MRAPLTSPASTCAFHKQQRTCVKHSAVWSDGAKVHGAENATPYGGRVLIAGLFPTQEIHPCHFVMVRIYIVFQVCCVIVGMRELHWRQDSPFSYQCVWALQLVSVRLYPRFPIICIKNFRDMLFVSR